jgi:3-hydroxyacyl-CoA dehydrogenase
VEEADAIMGKPMGVPKTGVFGPARLGGPRPDAARRRLHEGGAAGDGPVRDGHARARAHRADDRGGAHRAEGRQRAASTTARRARPAKPEARHRPLDRRGPREEKPVLESLEAGRKDLRRLVEHPDRGGRYARAVLLDTLGYAASLVPEVADDLASVDAAMRLGYNWTYGPFELADRLGPAWLAEHAARGAAPGAAAAGARRRGTFYREERGACRSSASTASTATCRARGRAAAGRRQARREAAGAQRRAQLWDIGDGVACLEFHSKMNALDPEILGLIGKAVAMGKKGAFRALVVHNEADNFSVGANIGLALFAANIGAWGEIEGMIEGGQKAMRAMRDAPFPVVGARPAWRSAAGARSCSIATRCRRTRRPTSAWWRWASASSPAGAAARPCCGAGRRRPRRRAGRCRRWPRHSR